VWVLWVPLLHGRWGCLCRLGSEPYPCYTDQEPCHSESHNLIYFTRMVKAGNGAQWPVACFPMWVYHCLPRWLTKPKSKWSCMRFPLPILTGICARGAKPIGAFGLVYQRLPVCRSEFEPTVRNLYQSLPPRRRTGDQTRYTIQSWTV
jgi:hypothetical protein